MNEIPVLADGAVELSAFTVADVPSHVAAEDEESVRWLTGGHRSTLATTTAWVEQHLEWWRVGGPRRMFAIREAATKTLAGMVEANLDNEYCGLSSGEVNLSYMIHPWARGRGFATRALELMCEFLVSVDGPRVAVLRIEADNAASLGVARRAGFVDGGWTVTPDGDRPRYFRRPLVRGS